PLGLEAYERKIMLLEKLNRKEKIVPALAAYLSDDADNLPLRLLYLREMAKAGQMGKAEREYLALADKAQTPEVYRGLFALYMAEKDGGKLVLKQFNEKLEMAAGNKQRHTEPNARAAAQGRAMLAVLREDPNMVTAVLEAARPKIGAGDLSFKTSLF